MRRLKGATIDPSVGTMRAAFWLCFMVGVIAAGILARDSDAADMADVCGWIGVQVSPMTKPFAESLGMTELYGAIFDRPEPNSPAAQAHIEAGDVLTAINGVPLSSSSAFIPTISAMAPDTEVDLTTYRDGQLMERIVTLGSSKCPGQPDRQPR
jgi:S1-C subfamily serine protease